MHANSKIVTSNQTGIHKNLEKTVQKYLSTEFKRPFAQHTLDAFAVFENTVKKHNKPLILDACCGTARSSAKLAELHPEHLIIGVDQSIHRLEKQQAEHDNLLLLQADLLDFYRLLANHQYRVDKHFLLYPNPWPKSTHLKRRWHAMPCFPHMLKLGGTLEVRSNWRLYLDEFAHALIIAGHTSTMQNITFENDSQISQLALTAFEEKYARSGQVQHQLICKIT